MNSRSHWETIYRERDPGRLSWFQPEATLSLALIRGVTDPSAAVIDVGGGASPLVDGLLHAGYRAVSVLDISGAALDVARRRLGDAAAGVNWVEGDVRTAPLPSGSADLWHDRAVLHFMVEPADQEAYVTQAARVLRPGGCAVIATFAEDGPTHCSGLPVNRCSVARLEAILGSAFALLDSRSETHRTPAGASQAFVYGVFRLAGAPVASDPSARW